MKASMIDWFTVWPVLAQDQGNGQPAPGGNIWALLFPLLAIGFLWYFLLLRPQRREQARRQDMLQALKKNDRVVTIGGIIGTVANITPDGDRVVLKIDDNTRIPFLRSSIQSVLRDEEGGEAAKK